MTFPRKIRKEQHLVVDDRTGFTVWSGDTVKEDLTGYRVRRRSVDPRHPQEMAKPPKAEQQSVPDPRPPGVANYVGPLITYTTATAAAGAQSLMVETNARFLSGDRIVIMLSTGDSHRAVVSTLSGTTIVNIAQRLPESVSVGATVVNISANSEVSFS